MQPVVLASRLATWSESATLALNARAQQLAAEGHTIYNLTAGELATDTPDYIQTAVAQHLSQNKYTPVAGLPELRAAIASHAKNYYGLDWIGPANVVVTAGAKPALAASFLALLNPGDEVILPVPGWTTSYRPLIELAGGQIVEVPLTEELDIDVTAIDAKLSSKTKAIIINSPNNPTGSIYSGAALRQLAKIVNQASITVIADDIYSQLVYNDSFVLAPTCGFENMIIINGLSKSQALTGWRIGYLIADKVIAYATTSLLSHLTGNAPLPSQYAAIEAMKHDDKPPASTLEALKSQRQLVLDGLQVAGLKSNNPGGAFYVFIDLRDQPISSAEWCEKLLNDAGVALVPGEAFSAPGYARLTFSAGEDILKPALMAIKEFVKDSS